VFLSDKMESWKILKKKKAEGKIMFDF
jgi:hypothetical protein